MLPSVSEVRRIDTVSLTSLFSAWLPGIVGQWRIAVLQKKEVCVFGSQHTDAIFCITANFSVSPRNVQFDAYTSACDTIKRNTEVFCVLFRLLWKTYLL